MMDTNYDEPVRLVLISRDMTFLSKSARTELARLPGLKRTVKRIPFSSDRCVFFEDERIGTFIYKWSDTGPIDRVLVKRSADQWRYIADGHELNSVVIPRFGDAGFPMKEVVELLSERLDSRFILGREEGDVEE